MYPSALSSTLGATSPIGNCAHRRIGWVWQPEHTVARTLWRCYPHTPCCEGFVLSGYCSLLPPPFVDIQEGQCAVSYTATLKHWCLWDTLWFCTHLARPTRPHLASVVAWVYPSVQGCQYATLPLGLLQHVAYAYLACCGVCLFVKRCSMLHGLYASGAMAMLLCLTSAGMAIIVPPIMVDCICML